MYLVKKNNRKATTTRFETYEAARQWIRKQARKQTRLRRSGQPSHEWGTLDMASFGFKIIKV